MTKLEREIGGRNLSIETGRIAKQANGAVWMQYGERRRRCGVQPNRVDKDGYSLPNRFPEWHRSTAIILAVHVATVLAQWSSMFGILE